ncbi:MAG: nucleotidyltransferase domain-containing protein [Aestuariivirga sp.]
MFKFSSPNHEAIISQLVKKISNIPHVQGIILGGSRGLNFATDASDYDLVIFYEDEFPITNESVFDVLKSFGNDVKPTPCGLRLTGKSHGLKFEIFYRSLTKVRAAVLDAQRGLIFLIANNHIPQGSLNLSLISFLVNFPILWDKDAALARVVSNAVPMPSKLRQALLEFALHGAFAAGKNAAGVRRPEMHKTYLLSHCVLFIWHLEIAIFAINHMYPVMSKQSMELLEALTAKPENWRKKVHKMLNSCMIDDLKLPLDLMRQLLEEVAGLAGVKLP